VQPDSGVPDSGAEPDSGVPDSGAASRCSWAPYVEGPPAATDETLESVQHFSYTTLTYPIQKSTVIESVELTLELCNVPEPRPYGLYYQIYMVIGGNPIYFGFQTSLHNPEVGFVGPGFIFSRWGSLDKNELRINDNGGFYELGTHEGEFIGVRLPYAFSATTYRVSLVHEGDHWYRLEFTPAGGAPLDVGSLRLSGNAGISGFTLTTEAYAMNKVKASNVPLWHLLVSVPKVNGIAATDGKVTYPSSNYPYGRVSLVQSETGWSDAFGAAPLLNTFYGSHTSRDEGINGKFVIP
jgi:hypothetical protein